MKMRLSQTQKQTLAPTMQQSIAVLLLPTLELNTAIEIELQVNPLLEVDEEQLITQNQLETDYLKKLEYSKEHAEFGEPQNFEEDDTLERPIVREVSLEDSLLKQLRLEISDPLHYKIGETIIGNLDDDGYLKINFEDIANICMCDIQPVEDVLKIIQNFEPVGIASRDLRECLNVQIQSQLNGHSELACSIVNHHLNELGLKNYAKIAKKFNTNVETIKKIGDFISTLEPKPARNYRPLISNLFIKPDITVKKEADGSFEIIVNKANITPIRINPIYKKLLDQKNISDEERVFIREKLKNAINFIKSIEQRGQTICEITKFVLDRQKSFFEGSQFSIFPMSLKDVAEAIDRNESTVCRAINNKYIDTPQGIFPLKFFFSQAISEDQDQLSTRGIKEQLKDLIESEDPKAPLSDQDIQTHFLKKGMKIARRTIAKYRQNLNILPSHLRKK